MPETARKKVTKRKAVSSSLFVVITSNTGDSFKIRMGEKLQTQAMRWSYTVARRGRWKSSALQQMQEQACESMKTLTNPKKLTEVLSKANVIDVQIPFKSEKIGWEARIAPWEFLIGVTAAELGNRNKITIVRSLIVGRQARKPKLVPKILFVQSAPSPVDKIYNFENELTLIKNTFDKDVTQIINPTIAELRARISGEKPNIIHIAGIDSHEIASHLEAHELPDDWAGSSIRDGLLLRTDDNDNTAGFEVIEAEQLAEVLTCASKNLELVTINVYNSASRICALTVANGASCALGYQDSINNSLAEVFLDEFYLDYFLTKDNFASFSNALRVARSAGEIKGTGIVLWNDTKLNNSSDKKLDDARDTREIAKLNSQSTGDGQPDHKLLQVDVTVRKRLNYSMLHNDSGGLFKRFTLSKTHEGRVEDRVIKDISVEANLFLGSESHSYESRFTLSNNIRHIDQEVKVPLTSSIIRTVSEALRTSLSVKVSVGERVVHQKTYRVTLLPADEWKDTESDRVWLPSFVLPRDPAVAMIIDRAQKYLATLADDMNQGFSGYQNMDTNLPPEIVDSLVDLQARAIWAAIVNDVGIRYINPPPSYSKQGQRLRTPSQIIDGGRGTCIDLALLYCSCLEYIDIFPVIFLFSGHAFAGYWRSEAQYEEFLESPLASGKKVSEEELANPGKTEAPWVFSSNSLSEISEHLTAGGINPVETVKFTSQGSFREAVESGKQDLKGKRVFNTLVDINLARLSLITPLPIIDSV